MSTSTLSVALWPSPSETLPLYTPPQEPEQICSTSLNNKGSAWLTLTAKSTHTASSSSQTMPLYKRAGAIVSGDIVMLLDKPDAIQAVKISLRGVSSYGGSENASKGSSQNLGRKYIFLEETETLWSWSDGVPPYSEPPPWGFPQNGRLQGKYMFPYSFQLPLNLSSEAARPNETPQTYALPASLYGKDNPAAIDYELSVILIRGPLKPNSLLNLNIIYAPRTKPDPPSEIRQSAYINRFPALDPLGDPLGWQSIIPPPKVKGKLVNGRAVEVACMFALAKPLTYARGSFIALNISLQCADTPALELLQSPNAVSIILLQRIITGKNAHIRKAKVGRDVHFSPVARAVCWPATSSGQWEDCRMLMGEIALPKKLLPSTVTPRVIIQYSVVMLPFDIGGFIPADLHSFVVDQPVDIATHNADGPSPCSQMPSGYEDPRKDSTDRFEQIMDAISMF